MTTDKIPVIDISPLASGDETALQQVADELCSAASTVGFFYIENHSIPQAQIDDVFALSRSFFGASNEQKRSVGISPFHRGWLELGAARMFGSNEADMKESFVWGLDIAEDDSDYRAGGRLLAPNRWPEFVPGMRETLMAYFHATQACGQQLLRAFAKGLDIAPDYFLQQVDKPVSRGSLIYYPPSSRATTAQVGAGAHTDYGTLTLLYQDDAGGLEIRGRSREWVRATPIKGAFVINVGDLLARWSNDRFASTLHRVVHPPGQTRYSVAMFIDSNWDAVVAPVTAADESARYEPVRCGDYIADRYDEAFAYRNAERRH